MVYKSIKNRGKRSKKYNRKTHKQNGGNKHLIIAGLIILSLLTMGVIVKVDAKFYNKYVDKDQNEKYIQEIKKLEAEKIKYKEDLTKLNKEDRYNRIYKRILAEFLPDSVKPIAQIGDISSLLVAPEKTRKLKEEISKVDSEITDRVIAINKDYVYIHASEFIKLLPLGTARDFGSSSLSTLLVNLENPEWSNFFNRKSVSAPIFMQYVNGNYYYALHVEEYLKLIGKNEELAIVAKDLTKSIIDDVGEKE
jgi:hypothetical protein